MNKEDKDPKWIDAAPTKEFFIHMLTRDVELTRSILDLIDNCIDGAKRTAPAGDYSPLWVRIEISKEKFRIVDNCGGMPVDVARNHAFRFGRPTNAKETPGSIGQFGVGMKRSFFKIGREFTVESSTSSSSLRIDVDVEKWMIEDDGNADTWHFKFTDVRDNRVDVPDSEIGTRIEIRRLMESVSESFSLENFKNRLVSEISLAHSVSMDRGLAISLNGIPVRHSPQKLLASDSLRPAFIEKSFPRIVLDGVSGSPVNVKLYAGISGRELDDGGWYIFCNGRLVVKSDQSAMTVWGPTHSLPQYHPNFARLRGFAYFDSDNASLLPWTTTKTGIDIDSKIYRLVQQEMIELTKPILEFLRKLEKERKASEAGETDEQPLQLSITMAKETRAESITQRGTFSAPQPAPVVNKASTVSIQYRRPTALVEKIKKATGASSATAVGEMTFDYFLKHEGED